MGHINTAYWCISIYREAQPSLEARAPRTRTHMHTHTHMHTPSVWGQGSLGRRSVVCALGQPGVGSKLFVIRHHIPLLAPVSGFSNLFHLSGGAIYTLLLLTSRKGGKRPRQKEGKQQVSAVGKQGPAWCADKTAPLPLLSGRQHPHSARAPLTDADPTKITHTQRLDTNEEEPLRCDFKRG